MFGQTVLAELPSSMRAQSPNETRSVEAAFVHSRLDTGPVVQGAVRIDGELILKRLVARNVKPITREALLSEAGFEKLFRTQNWVRRSKLFCR